MSIVWHVHTARSAEHPGDFPRSIPARTGRRKAVPLFSPRLRGWVALTRHGLGEIDPPGLAGRSDRRAAGEQIFRVVVLLSPVARRFSCCPSAAGRLGLLLLEDSVLIF